MIIMENNEEVYIRALEKIAALTAKIAWNFEVGDDDMSHYFTNVYRALNDVDIDMWAYYDDDSE